MGDFDGDGVDTPGLHRESTGLVYYRNWNSEGVADAIFLSVIRVIGLLRTIGTTTVG